MISTGIQEFNYLFDGGYELGKIYGIFAFVGCGKSTIIQELSKIGDFDERVVFLATEQMPKDIVENMTVFKITDNLTVEDLRQYARKFKYIFIDNLFLLSSDYQMVKNTNLLNTISDIAKGENCCFIFSTNTPRKSMQGVSYPDTYSDVTCDYIVTVNKLNISDSKLVLALECNNKKELVTFKQPYK